MAVQVLENVEKVLRIPELVFVDLSKNGRFALFLSNVSGSYQLWSFDMQKGCVNQVSQGDQRVIYAEISPDFENVVFSRDFGGAERHQLFLAPITGQRQEKQISKLEDVRVFDFAWSPYEKGIALTGSTVEANFLWLFDVESQRCEVLYKNENNPMKKE
jgi:Tol biopolymer transport system component